MGASGPNARGEGSSHMPDIQERAVTFPSAGSPSYTLEGRLSQPATIAGERTLPGVVLCHPQPATSSMDDPLLARIAADAASSGMACLRLNFRGVGASEGQTTDGRLEPLDLAGAIAFLVAQPAVNPGKLALVGHAFGAYMALTYAQHDERIRTVVAISPPLVRVAPGLGAFDRPKLFVTGEYDEVAPRHKLEPWIATLPGGCGLRIVSDARHLMRGHEAVASEAVVRYLARWAATPGL